MTRNDRVLLYSIAAFLVLIVVAGIVVRFSLKKDHESVMVLLQQHTTIYSLNEDRIIDIGTHHIEIQRSSVRITHAQCKDKICEKTGWIKSGIIVCAPFKLAVFVTPAKQSPIDAITY